MTKKLMKAFAIMSTVMMWAQDATEDSVITAEEAMDLVQQIANQLGMSDKLAWNV